MIPFPKKKYQIIYADPPWRFNVWNRDTGLGRSADSHYQTMLLKDIKNLPISKIANKNCCLFLWITCPMLIEGLEVISSWGFKFKTIGFVWIKKNKISNTPFFGMGYWTRANAEMCLIATKGKIKRINNNIRQVIISEIKEHSRKPDELRYRIVQLMGDLPRIELFAREKVKGWDSWGNEVKGEYKSPLEEFLNEG